jgi:hypothetical protein
MTKQAFNEEGIARIQKVLAAAPGTEVLRPYFLSLLAEACTATG